MKLNIVNMDDQKHKNLCGEISLGPSMPCVIPPPFWRLALDAERRLAELYGWTNIIVADRTLIGTPPEGGDIQACRGQAVIPEWARVPQFSIDLMVRHDIWPVCKDGIVTVRSSATNEDISSSRIIESKQATISFALVCSALILLGKEANDPGQKAWVDSVIKLLDAAIIRENPPKKGKKN